MLKARIAALMDKKMDRKSFLVHAAAGAVAILGASTAFRALSEGTTGSSATAASTQAYGYGEAPYGY